MEEFPDNVETAEAAPEPAGAENTAKKLRGKPITKETARAYQMSSTQAKRRRKETRMKMLAALTDRLDMGEELYKALADKDPVYLEMIEKATRLVGLRWEDSEEGREQRFKVDTKADISAKLQAPSLNITFKDAEPKE
jgi:hypothetical protein